MVARRKKNGTRVVWCITHRKPVPKPYQRDGSRTPEYAEVENLHGFYGHMPYALLTANVLSKQICDCLHTLLVCFSSSIDGVLIFRPSYPLPREGKEEAAKPQDSEIQTKMAEST